MWKNTNIIYKKMIFIYNKILNIEYKIIKYKIIKYI